MIKKFYRHIFALFALALLVTPALGGCGAEVDGPDEGIVDGDIDTDEAEQELCGSCYNDPTCTPIPAAPAQGTCSQTCQRSWANYYGAVNAWYQMHCDTSQNTSCAGTAHGPWCITDLMTQMDQQCPKANGSSCGCQGWTHCRMQCYADHPNPRSGISRNSCLAVCDVNYPDCAD